MNQPSQGAVAKYSVWLSIVFFVLSMLMPAFRFSSSGPFFRLTLENWPGLIVLMSGWLGAADFCFAWYANPVGLFALLAFRKSNFKKSFNLSIIAFALALTALFLKSVPLDVNTGIYGMGLGYYVWLLSILCVLCGSMYCIRKSGE
jgi:hypothetical protein